jgi:ribonuclease Z
MVGFEESHMPRMSELLFIGTGGSVATEERDNTSFVLASQEKVILIDCPGSVIQKLKRSRIEPRSVHSMIITHSHPDHIYGLPSFVHSLMMSECSIDIFGSKLCVDFCASLLDLFNLRKENVKCRVNFIAVEEGQDHRISPGLSCSFYKVPHSPSSMAIGFHLETEKLDLLYSGDTPPYPRLLKKMRKLDFLIHDCSAPSRFFAEYPALGSMHTDSLTLGQMAHDAGAAHLVPCHFFGELDYSIEEIEEEIKNHYKGKLTIPSDFSCIHLLHTST